MISFLVQLIYGIRLRRWKKHKRISFLEEKNTKLVGAMTSSVFRDCPLTALEYNTTYTTPGRKSEKFTCHRILTITRKRNEILPSQIGREFWRISHFCSRVQGKWEVVKSETRLGETNLRKNFERNAYLTFPLLLSCSNFRLYSDRRASFRHSQQHLLQLWKSWRLERNNFLKIESMSLCI